MLEVWRLSFHAGMLAKQVLTDNKNVGNIDSEGLCKILFSHVTDHDSLKAILSSKMLLLGVISEILDIKEIN